MKTLYFIRALHSGRIKVGRSDKPNARLASFQTGSPEPLELIAAMPETESVNEQSVHDAFAADCVVGEWFEPDNLLPWLKAHLLRAFEAEELRRERLRTAGMETNPTMTTEQALERMEGAA